VSSDKDANNIIRGKNTRTKVFRDKPPRKGASHRDQTSTIEKLTSGSLNSLANLDKYSMNQRFIKNFDCTPYKQSRVMVNA
jgi:hypothetical protein